MTLHLSDPGENFDFLNVIHTPVLVHLDVFGYIGNVTAKPGTLKAFIHKMSVLRDNFRVSLHLDAYDPPGFDEIVNFLRHVPKVNRLTLEGIITELEDRGEKFDFFDALSRFKPQESLLAELEILAISGLPANFDWSGIERYIKSRRRDDKFKTLIVKYGTAYLPEGCTIDTAACVKRVAEMGISVDVTYPKLYRRDVLGMYNL